MPALADIASVQPMAPTPSVVRHSVMEIPGTVTLEIEPPGNVPLAFAPGQFNMLYLFGVGEVPISMSGDPDRADTLVHTVRDVGAITHGIASLQPGAVVGVRGPFGTSWPIEQAAGSDVVVIAGGIGLAPLRPAVYTILNHRDRYDRVSILYGARTPADLLYPGELASWRARFDVDAQVTVDSATDGWHGDVDVVPALIPRAPFDPGNVIAMVCGPEIMMRFAVAALRERGVADDRIFVSMERNMRCAIGFCGHCQLGPTFVCKDGPVFSYDYIGPWMTRREV